MYRYLIALLLFGLPGPTEAIVYRFSASGAVDAISAYQGGPITVPNGGISVGDAFNISFSFDTQQAVVSPVFDSDPTINIYNFQPTDFEASIGGYTYAPVFTFPHEVGLQVWNDRVVAGATDSQSFSFQSRGANPLPFPTSDGYVLEQLWLFAFDYTTSARQTDLLPELAEYSSFGSTFFQWSQYDQELQQNILVSGRYMATIVAVPEQGTAPLVALAALGLVFVRRRRLWRSHSDAAPSRYLRSRWREEGDRNRPLNRVATLAHRSRHYPGCL